MATYYWLGSRSADVMDNKNWSIINPETFSGISGTTSSLPHATTVPGYNDNVIFDKFTIAGATQAFTYPLFPPTGTMGISGGSTGAYLNNVQIMGNYHMGIGQGPRGFTAAENYLVSRSAALTGSYLNISASIIELKRFASNGSTFAYRLNLIGSVGSTGATGDIRNILKISAYESDTTNKYDSCSVYVIGQGQVLGEPQSSQPTSGNIFFGATFAGKIGPFTNPLGGEYIHLHSGITHDTNWPIQFFGCRNYVAVEEGFQTTSNSRLSFHGFSTRSPDNGVNRIQFLTFLPKDFSGISGGITSSSTGTTSVELQMVGSKWEQNHFNILQRVAVNHPVDFRTLEMWNGAIGFETPYAGTSRVFQGAIGTDASMMIYYRDSVVLMAPGGYSPDYTGVSIRDNSPYSTEPRSFPIQYRYSGTGLDYKIVLGGDDNYWKKQWNR